MLTISFGIFYQKWSFSMKKLAPIFTTIIFIAIIIIAITSISDKKQIISVYEGNLEKKPILITPDKYADIECSMTIKSQNHSAQVISPSGKTWFFDDIGCLIKWLEDKKFKGDAVLWTHVEDTDDWIDAKKAWYVLTDATPMGYGFGAREHKVKGSINFEQMKLKMLRGENLTDPKLRKKLLGL
jgi:flagellin-like protein